VVLGARTDRSSYLIHLGLSLGRRARQSWVVRCCHPDFPIAPLSFVTKTTSFTPDRNSPLNPSTPTSENMFAPRALSLSLRRVAVAAPRVASAARPLSVTAFRAQQTPAPGQSSVPEKKWKSFHGNTTNQPNPTHLTGSGVLIDDDLGEQRSALRRTCSDPAPRPEPFLPTSSRRLDWSVSRSSEKWRVLMFST
jgi:hypothetical protein